MDEETRSLLAPFCVARGRRAVVARSSVPAPAAPLHPARVPVPPPPAAPTVQAHFGHRFPATTAGATLPCVLNRARLRQATNAGVRELLPWPPPRPPHSARSCVSTA